MRLLASALPLAAALLMITSPATLAQTVLPPEARSALALTLYADGDALVADTRTAALPAGRSRVIFDGVSREMLPSSARIAASEGVRLLDVDYDFALLTSEALLRRSVGQEVGVARPHPTSGEMLVEWATLLSVAGVPVLRFRDHVGTAEPGEIVFRSVPAGLRATPTLGIGLDAASAGERPLTLSYLTRGLGWSVDYVADLKEAVGDAAEGTLSLTARATLSNSSGADFPAAQVALIAGQVNREQDMAPRPAPMLRSAAPAAMTEDATAKSVPERAAFADLHLYAVPEPVNLADQQTRQIALQAPLTVPVKREYISEAVVSRYAPMREPQPSHPLVRLRFVNQPGSDEGSRREAAPLPAGLVRLYAEGPGGVSRLLGEDRIEHTPGGATVTLTPGRVFDVTVTRRQTEFNRSGPAENAFESAWAITVANARDKPATVRVVEVVPGEWKVLAESAAHEKEAADRLVWSVTAPARGETQLTYRIRVQR